jgi:hypothetical protein
MRLHSDYVRAQTRALAEQVRLAFERGLDAKFVEPGHDEKANLRLPPQFSAAPTPRCHPNRVPIRVKMPRRTLNFVALHKIDMI